MVQFRRSVLGILTCLVLFGSRDLASQRPRPIGAQPPVIFPDSSSDKTRASDPNSCPGKRIAMTAMGPIGGAVGGFIGFTFGIGVLADDHGEVYQNYRRRWMLYGAAIGTGVGLFRALTSSCDVLFDRPYIPHVRVLSNAAPPS
jgi:hypothetical protein